MRRIHAHGEAAYPEEGAGLMLGSTGAEDKTGRSDCSSSPMPASTPPATTATCSPPQDYLHGEMEAARLGLDVIGVFHSHPDHPNRPSEFDREWAMPFLSYVITSVQSGVAVESRSWLLERRSLGFYRGRYHRPGDDLEVVYV